MNQTFIIIFLFVIIITLIILSYNGKEYHEYFTSNDPTFVTNSCKNITREKNKVNNLSKKYCTPKDDLKLVPNREKINKERACYDMIEKKSMLDIEQSSWCSRISEPELNRVNKELAEEKIVEPEGYQFMSSQFEDNGIKAFGFKNNYASFNDTEINFAPSSAPNFEPIF